MTSEPTDGAVRVLYVAGTGRSGSTVLDALLGSGAEIASTGELTNLVAGAWREGRPCSCGEPADRCAFWSGVRERWRAAGADEAALERYVALQRRYERLRSLPRVATVRAGAAGGFAEYARLSAALFAAIRAESGARVVVDSSKLPVRAFALARSPGIDLRLLHLVRDVRGVAWSHAKGFERDLAAGLERTVRGRSWRSVLRSWLVVNGCVELTGALGRLRRARLRYEDLVSEPRAALAAIGRLVDLDLAALAERVERGEAFAPGHLAAGNRARMGGALVLRADVEWRERMRPGERARLWWGGAPMLRRYGYARSGA